jgi:cytochrome c peroxidase
MAVGRRVAVRGLVALAIALGGLVTWTVAGGSGPAGARGGAPDLAPLDTMPVPTPPQEGQFIASKGAAVKLGKALFWDMQAGSDGRTACASCHYNAGADNRSRNQINPRNPSVAAFTLKGPNADLTADDFPFHKFADPKNRDSAVLSDTANVAGSQGVLPSLFDGITLGEPVDDQTFAAGDPLFEVGGQPVRRSTGRNSPSVINAVFNFRNFWDGRAQNDFNGVNPFGSRDPSARVGRVNAAGGVDEFSVSLTNSSLASQATGPPGNDVEMSAGGRNLSDIGHKLLSLRPLRTQIVSPTDSVLGADVADTGRGLRQSYADLIRAAFRPEWWNSTETRERDSRAFPLMEFNFPLFWGLAIQAYESTLVSDRTPVDRFLEGETTALSPAAVRGMAVFQGDGDCTECHNGPALSSATVLDIEDDSGLTELDKAGRTVDVGFQNIGVRPTGDDPGVGGTDPFGNPLSASRLGGAPNTAVDGAFKVPGLRNVELTAPYFHNGGQGTLRQLVDFYSRGGDFAGNSDLSPDLDVLDLTDAQKDDLVEFLKALTDPRVRSQSAPFDHPELFVPAGEQSDESGALTTSSAGRAVDCFRQVSATGAAGGAPLATFPTFTGPPCQAAPDLHNPPPVPRPAPAATPAPGGAAGAAPAAGPAPPGAVAGSVRRSGARCVVPRLRGRTVAQARRLLARAKCRLGHVTTPRRAGRRPVVAGQEPGAGSRRVVNTRVRVRLRARR